MKWYKIALSVIAAYCGILTAVEPVQPAPDDTVQGFYAWPDMPDGIMKLTMRSFADSSFRKKFWEDHKKRCENGQRRFMILELVFPENIPGSRVPTFESARRDLKNFLVSTPEAPAYPELIYAVVPSEEHRIQDIPKLNELYDYIKTTYRIKVFQWLSEPLVPPADFKADGWVFDAYCLKSEAFYQHCRKFMLYGKVMFPVMWFAEAGFSGYYRENLKGLLNNARDKMAICRALDLPMFWFAVCKKHGSVGCWMSNKPGFPDLREQFQTLLRESKNATWLPQIPIKDFSLPVSGEWSWQENFKKTDLLDHCALSGAKDALLTPQGLQFRTEKGRIQWQFRTPDKCTQGELTVRFSGNAPEVQVISGSKKMSLQTGHNEKTLKFDLTGLSTFTVEITGHHCILQNLTVKVSGKAAEVKQLKLNLQTDGTVTYDEKLTGNLFENTVESPSPADNIDFRPGVAVLMKKQWIGQQKIVFNETVRQVSVTVRCFANGKSWACYVDAGLSVDGQNIQWQSSRQQRLGQPLKLELNNPGGMKQCYLHLKLTNNSGVYPKNGAPAQFKGYVLTGKR